MTTLITWVGVDPRGLASLYLASDSRISFEPSDQGRAPGHVAGQLWWNVGVKLFACRSTPDVFGYCGDVVFPALVLNQFVSAADQGLLFPEDANSASRNFALENFIKNSHSIQKDAPKRSFTIVHVSRDGSGMLCTFSVKAISFDAKSSNWSSTIYRTDADQSRLVATFGSGAYLAKNTQDLLLPKAQGGTSRSIFWAFCDHLKSGSDPLSGGAPQIISIFRQGMPEVFGIVWNGERYYLGARLLEASLASKIKWRDELFQRIDGLSLDLEEGAQRHGR